MHKSLGILCCLTFFPSSSSRTGYSLAHWTLLCGCFSFLYPLASVSPLITLRIFSAPYPTPFLFSSFSLDWNPYSCIKNIHLVTHASNSFAYFYILCSIGTLFTLRLSVVSKQFMHVRSESFRFDGGMVQPQPESLRNQRLKPYCYGHRLVHDERLCECMVHVLRAECANNLRMA
jgi:hypothetical protein